VNGGARMAIRTSAENISASGKGRLIVDSAGTLPTDATLSAALVVFTHSTTSTRQQMRVKPDWVPDVVESVTELLRMKEDWDSYSARRIATSAAVKLVNLLVGIVDFNTPKPFVYGLTDGGVGVEWKTRRRLLQLEVEGSGEVSVYYLDSQSGNEWEGLLGEEPDGIEKLLWLVTAST
jgi:hypothetical protein